MTEKIKLVQGDTRPAIVCSITDEITGLPLNLTGAVVVMRFRASGATELTATVLGAITNEVGGVVAFYPASAPEMLQGAPGDYEGEIEITFSDSQIQSIL